MIPNKIHFFICLERKKLDDLREFSLLSPCHRFGMSFPNKEDRPNCQSRRDEYRRCLDEGNSSIEFREQYEKC